MNKRVCFAGFPVKHTRFLLFLRQVGHRTDGGVHSGSIPAAGQYTDCLNFCSHFFSSCMFPHKAGKPASMHIIGIILMHFPLFVKRMEQPESEILKILSVIYVLFTGRLQTVNPVRDILEDLFLHMGRRVVLCHIPFPG